MQLLSVDCGRYNIFKKNLNMFFAHDNMKKSTFKSSLLNILLLSRSSSTGGPLLVRIHLV